MNKMSLEQISKESIDEYILANRPEGHPHPWQDLNGRGESYILQFKELSQDAYNEIPEIKGDVSVTYQKGMKILILKGQIDESNERIHMIMEYLNDEEVNHRHKMMPEMTLWNLNILTRKLLNRTDAQSGVYYDVFFLFPE